MNEYFANFGVSCGASYKSNNTHPHEYKLSNKPFSANSNEEAFQLLRDQAKATIASGLYPNPRDNYVTVKLLSLQTREGEQVPFNKLSDGVVKYSPKDKKFYNGLDELI